MYTTMAVAALMTLATLGGMSGHWLSKTAQGTMDSATTSRCMKGATLTNRAACHPLSFGIISVNVDSF